MAYLEHILILISIYTILAISLDLLVGHTGLLPISHAAFYGIGSYTSALLAIRLGVPFILGLLAGMCIAGLLSLLVSLHALRLREDYLAIATFSFQVIAFSLFNNWTRLTKGPLGIMGIPKPDIFGATINSSHLLLALSITLAGFSYAVITAIASSPFGRVLHAIREDELFAQSLGKNTFKYKLTAFTVSAALAGAAGSLYAHYVTYIDPTSYTVPESILVISMVIIGGAGSRWGPLVGAVTLVSIPEGLRLVGLQGPAAANLRQMIYGALLVVTIMIRPHGLMGKRGFRP